MADFFERSVLAWKNKQYDLALNGEAALLQRLRPFAPTTVFDVGANIGDWAEVACKALPGATVHGFEIAEATASQLVSRIATAGLDARVVINRVGLGASEGEITLFVTPESNTESSTLRAAVEFALKDQALSTIVETTARITTGDAYLRARDIAHVDLLKIDVEGTEFSVLKGFAETFARGAIDLVQFEYGPLNLTTRKLLVDFYAFFTAYGFVLGNDLPGGCRVQVLRADRRGFCRSELPRLPPAARGHHRGAALPATHHVAAP
ncbi:MAG TPA: FkbM family methyltransferase [Acetobacteraceae bacterium]|jgi:FkbM family methyltransferase|nr:FkbM family methyltransferase [Acetobacteraceae bacterium]